MFTGRQPQAHEGLRHHFGLRTSVDGQLDDVGGVGPPLSHHVHREPVRRCSKPLGIGFHRRRRHGHTDAGQLVAWRLPDAMAPGAIGVCRPDGLGRTRSEKQRARAECNQSNSASRRGLSSSHRKLQALAPTTELASSHEPALHRSACTSPTLGGWTTLPTGHVVSMPPALRRRISDARARWRSARSGDRCGSARQER